MKTRFGFFLSLPLLLSASQAALAAATPEEAARLTTVFQSYLTAEPGVVKVEPDGDDYTVTLDIAPLATKAASAGAIIALTPVKLTLSDAGDGKWNVSQEGPLSFSMKAAETVTADVKIEDYSWEGVFDEKLSTFSESSAELKNVTFAETVNDPNQGKTDVSVSIKDMKIEQTAKAGAAGGADITAKYEMDTLSETLNTGGNPASGIPPMSVVMTAANGTYDTSATGMKVKSVFDLVSFFVSHTSEELIKKDQVALKTMLASALPIFENVQASGTFNTLNIATPMGPAGAESITIGADINGVVKEGKLRESLSISGLSVPPAIVPPWATTLVPKNVTFDFSVSGFDLAAPAQLILAALDLTKDKPLPDGFEATLLPALLPTGNATITLNPTSISNDLYSVNAEGSMTAGPTAMPSGKATISAKGLDDVLKVIQAAPAEAGVQSGVSIVIAAKGMGKAAADGTLTWEIESTPDAKVLVNGIDVSKMQ